ncbi:hypothetical protein JOC75_000481 [Metabacillus crassostreae]|nr:hypothetical protein [Metabacillus crassostreae]
MDLLTSVLSFVGNIVSAWSMAAWSYFQEKLGNG